MNAFWGLPTSVATLPTFAAIATATRYGSGFTRRARVLRTTTGVTSNAIVSFNTMADNAAVATMSHARNVAWFFARSAIREETRSKNPQISSPDTRGADGPSRYGTLRDPLALHWVRACPITLK